MIRYFYFIYLLVCIENVFCYDYISDGSDLRSSNFIGKRKPLKNNRRFKRQEYEPIEEGSKERMNVAEIDLASFMRRPDYENLEDNESYETGARNRKNSLKDYGDYGTLAKSEDNNSQRKDKSYFDDNLLELNNVDQGPEFNAAVEKKKPSRPKKKTLSQKMKIPFFSHKTETQKMKKNKKRKLVRSTSKKKVAAPSGSPAQSESKNSYDMYDMNKKKRSYKEHICSICRRRFRVSVKDPPGNKKTANDMVHNSRQYFQEIDAKNRDKLRQGSNTVTSEAEKVDTKAPDETLQVERMRRGNDERERQLKDVQDNEPRERQLKELDEVRQKIDNVEIKMVMPERKTG